MVTVYDFILNSTPHDVSVVRKHVMAHLNNIVGPVGNRRNLGHDACVKTAKVVKKLLRTIENRLKQSPEIDLYQAHKFFCQTYLKHLCSMMTPPSYDYLNSRCDLIGCYEYLEKLEDIQREGLEVLNDISRLSVGRWIPQGQVLPTYPGGCDYKIAETVIKMCMVLLTARWNSIKEDDFMLDELEETENEDIYEYILSLANEMDPWIEHFRSLPYHDLIRQWLAAFFKDRTLSLVKKRLKSEVLWIREYCTMTLSNFVKASMDDEICNFGEEICHLVLSKSDDIFFSDSSIVICVLEFIAERCMDRTF
ncbi:separase isoform X1 [Tanacetum coccineum]